MGSQRAIMDEYRMLSPRQSKPRAGEDCPLCIHVLDGAQALPFLDFDSLPLVARALSATGSVVVIEYDDLCQRLRFYSQDEWLRGGRLVARRDDSHIGGLRRDAAKP